MSFEWVGPGGMRPPRCWAAASARASLAVACARFFGGALVASIGLLLVVATGPLVARAAEESGPPNVVLILADDLGWSDLGCYGADVHRTPHLDRLAAEGVRCTQAYAAAPVCTPSRAALLTGIHPARLHLTVWREASVQRSTQADYEADRPLVTPQTAFDLPHAAWTLAERLGRAGYLAFHVGKWHLGDAGGFPETHGFDLNLGGTHWGAPATYFHPFRGSERFQDGIRYVPGLGLGQQGQYLTDRLTDEALRLIDEAGERPFFLNLWHYGVHTPLEAPADAIADCRQRIAPRHRHQNATYAAMVENLDRNVGRVLARLEERGLRRRTLVIFTSDNGGFLGRPGGAAVTNNAPLRSGKGSLYEGGLRVPLLVSWPSRLPLACESSAPLAGTDLVATILEAVGLAEQELADPNPADGQSRWAQLVDPARPTTERDLFFHFPHYYSTTTPASAVRAGDWKLLHYYEDGHRELYNLAVDPGEQHNLADEEAQRTADLAGRLDRWLGEVGAQLPTLRGEGGPAGR